MVEEQLRFCLCKIEKQVAKKTFQAFVFCTLADWPVPQVCEVLDMTPAQVYVAKSRMTGRLRAEMRDLVEEGE